MTLRVGIGYDLHPLGEGRPLRLGGVAIPFSRGLEGHSDGDVLLHAIVDALLGAAGLGDLGLHFPATDPSLQGIASLTLLERTWHLLQEGRWQVVNVDATIVAQEPRLAPYLPAMRESIASPLGLSVEAVNIKATSPEGRGSLGRGEAIAAQAVALLERGE